MYQAPPASLFFLKPTRLLCQYPQGTFCVKKHWSGLVRLCTRALTSRPSEHYCEAGPAEDCSRQRQRRAGSANPQLLAWGSQEALQPLWRRPQSGNHGPGNLLATTLCPLTKGGPAVMDGVRQAFPGHLGSFLLPRRLQKPLGNVRSAPTCFASTRPGPLEHGDLRMYLDGWPCRGRSTSQQTLSTRKASLEPRCREPSLTQVFLSA